MSGQDPWRTQIFAARLHPHRSLSQRNFRLLMMIFAGSAFFTSVPFVILGAWPVAGFMGLDVLIFWLAFRANFRAARAYEDVVVTPLELAIDKVPVKGARALALQSAMGAARTAGGRGLRPASPRRRLARPGSRSWRISGTRREGGICRPVGAGAGGSAAGATVFLRIFHRAAFSGGQQRLARAISCNERDDAKHRRPDDVSPVSRPRRLRRSSTRRLA